MSTTIIDVLKTLIDLKTSFSNQTLDPLIDFIFQHPNRILRDSVIDCLEKIINYETISIDLLKRIQLEIVSKDLRDPKKDSEEKKILPLLNGLNVFVINTDYQSIPLNHSNTFLRIHSI